MLDSNAVLEIQGIAADDPAPVHFGELTEQEFQTRKKCFLGRQLPSNCKISSAPPVRKPWTRSLARLRWRECPYARASQQLTVGPGTRAPLFATAVECRKWIGICPRSGGVILSEAPNIMVKIRTLVPDQNLRRIQALAQLRHARNKPGEYFSR